MGKIGDDAAAFIVAAQPRNCCENFTFARYADRWVSARVLNGVGGCDVESCNFLLRAPIVFSVPCDGYQWVGVCDLSLSRIMMLIKCMFHVISALISVAFWWCEEQDRPDKCEQICILPQCTVLVRYQRDI